MNKTIGLVLLTGAVFAWMYFDNESSDTATPKTASSDQCPTVERFMQDHPEASDEQIWQVMDCNRNQLVKSGKDRRGTGFLGNRNIRPPGALAHYEGGYGSFVFTLYADRIDAVDAGDQHQFALSSIQSVTKSGPSMVIEYLTPSNHTERFGLSLYGADEDLKSEGNTDLDRLVDLINELRS
ncbi:MAG: hypothetical protein DHS20C11_29130 [Lysobacteraceae bacterium]|nr:MAG: hypothetical protein DHS20C11_29130 [Xanthomonadaceae bacterium]